VTVRLGLRRPDGPAPPPPREPHVDAVSGAWILSRYAEVALAFRDPRLWPVNASGDDDGDERDEMGAQVRRAEVQEALSAARMEQWQTRAAVIADTVLRELPTGRAVDLLSRFALPWCLRLGVLATGVSDADAARLGTLAADAWAGSGLRRRAFLRRRRATAAVAALERYFAGASFPMGRPSFVGMVQTLPRLLASGWLALVRHPGEVARLRAEPQLLPRAVEELLRYAGIVPRLHRRATADVALGSVRVKAGERVTLMIASANRDPEQFPDPNRLDVSRAATGQLALGLGRSSCAGARMVRMAFAVSIAAMLDRYARIDLSGPVRWRFGNFHWPLSVPVVLEPPAS
jgi:cytochrome P450